MKFKPIIIIAGEPNSIFSEIFLKTIKKKKIKSPIILICSKKIFLKQAKKLKKKFNFNEIYKEDLTSKKIKIKKLNLLNVNYNQPKAFQKISTKSNKYIDKCFKTGLELTKIGVSNKIINGPISKEHFLKNKFNGITVYLAHKTKSKNFAMVIFNKKLSVCPVTTHLPLKYVSSKINKIDIINKVKLINIFWNNIFNRNVKIGVTGLNPHCESIDKFNEDKKIILPAVKYLKKLKYNIEGPLSADTIFLKKNRKKYNLIIGMYHDQVLSPIKTLFEYDAINITLGLPFIRVSPDHGTNEKMIGKNISVLKLIIQLFLDKN